MKPKIGIFGSGWVGLVTGACFAELGHEVVIRDVLPERIEALQAGRVPLHEPVRLVARQAYGLRVGRPTLSRSRAARLRSRGQRVGEHLARRRTADQQRSDDAQREHKPRQGSRLREMEPGTDQPLEALRHPPVEIAQKTHG